MKKSGWFGQLQSAVHVEKLFIAPAYSKVRYRSPNFCPSVRSSVRPSCPSTFTSKFDIYVEVFVSLHQ